MVWWGTATFAAKKIMEKNNWITTEQMLKDLKNDPDNEHEYRHYICSCLRSTHWLIYNSKKERIGHSSDWNHYDWYTEEEFLDYHKNEWWHRDA